MRNPGRSPMKVASKVIDRVMGKVIDRVIQTTLVIALVGAALALMTLRATASSHREAPLITEMPKVDGTDFYMFRSYESSRSGFVTLIANYYPLQDPTRATTLPCRSTAKMLRFR